MESTYQAGQRMSGDIAGGTLTHDVALTALLRLRDQWEAKLREAEAQGDREEILRAWREVGHCSLMLVDFEAFKAAEQAGRIDSTDLFDAMAAIADEAVILRWWQDSPPEDRPALLRRLARTYGMTLPRLPEA